MTRVYAPTTAHRLRAALGAGSFGSALAGHTVTAAVRASLKGEDEEAMEHAVVTVAAQAAVSLLAPDERPRRIVLALDVPAATEVGGEDPTAVEVEADVPLQRLAAVMCDAADAEPAVAAARGSEELLDACLDHELGWWAVQELDQLLEDLT